MILHHSSSKTMRFLVRLLEVRYKRSGVTLLQQRHKTNAPVIPNRWFDTSTIHSITVYSKVRPQTDIHIFYLHGGAYVHYGDKLHFRFLKTLSKQAKVSVHYIDYPLAGTSTLANTTQSTIDVIQELQDRYPGRYYMMGDSSGGGLALAIADQLQNIEGYFLMSPWVDVSLSNPQLNQSDFKDGFYTKQDLQDCGTLYAPGEETSQLASPLYKESLPEVDFILYNGTADLLYPDIVRFEQKFPHILVHQFERAPHVFPLIPFTAEQKHFIRQFKAHIKSR